MEYDTVLPPKQRNFPGTNITKLPSSKGRPKKQNELRTPEPEVLGEAKNATTPEEAFRLFLQRT